jgi:hypothetical protein
MIDDSCFCEPACEEFVSNDDYREAFYELIPNFGRLAARRVRPRLRRRGWIASRSGRQIASTRGFNPTRLWSEKRGFGLAFFMLKF